MESSHTEGDFSIPLSMIFMSEQTSKDNDEFWNIIHKVNGIENIDPCINNLENNHSFNIFKTVKMYQKNAIKASLITVLKFLLYSPHFLTTAFN